MCVFDECDTPLELYSSSREWLAHMRSKHRMRWHCFATSHEPSFFESPGVLEDHLREIHVGHFSNEEISFLIETSRHPSLSVIEHCPFCQETAENIEEHVARHLIQFALRSLPWPDDCYSNCHPSQPSHSAHINGTKSSSEANGDDGAMQELRETDWDAWEKDIEAKDGNVPTGNLWHDARPPAVNPWHVGPPLTGERNAAVELYDFLSPNYDAAEDELLEPFRQRANVGIVKTPPSETRLQLDERQEFVQNLIEGEATFIMQLNVLAEIYKGTSNAVSKLDQFTIDRLFKNLNQLIMLHEGLLKDLKAAVPSNWEGTQIPISHGGAASSSPTAPKSIGAVVLENVRRLRPEHEEYYINHERATSLWQSLRKE